MFLGRQMVHHQVDLALSQFPKSHHSGACPLSVFISKTTPAGV